MSKKLWARSLLPASDEIGIDFNRSIRWRRSWYPLEKRVFDIGATLVALPIWLPLLVLILAAVKLGDIRQPALFRQWRTGQNGKRFLILKVRTMTPEREGRSTNSLDRAAVLGSQFKSPNDPRVTRLGRALRRTHLDELPQLVNVLKGDMSLVGPRPNTPPVELYRDWWRPRLQCKPGITGLWQVRRSPGGEYDERARFDITYLRRRSIALDAHILFATLIASFIRRSGA